MATQTDARSPIPTVGLVAGGLLILTSAAFPRAPDPADYGGVLDLLAAHAGRTRFVLLAVPLGIWALAAGIGALHSRITTPAAVTWLRLGVHAVVIGAAVATIQFALGHAALAERVSGPSDSTMLWAAATYVRSFGMLVLWAGLAALGRAVLIEGVAARWLGAVPIPLAAAMVAASVTTILAGPTNPVTNATGAIATLTAVWAVLFGLSLARSVSPAVTAGVQPASAAVHPSPSAGA
jgi:hypothetical protein